MPFWVSDYSLIQLAYQLCDRTAFSLVYTRGNVQWTEIPADRQREARDEFQNFGFIKRQLCHAGGM